MSVESLPGEEWKPVPVELYKEYYMVSSLGRVKSLDRYVFKKNERTQLLVANNFKEKLLKLGVIRGYNSCTLIYKQNRKTCRVGQLVAEAFLPKPDCIHNWYVHHKDGNSFNDRLSNLEWKPSIRECVKALNAIDPEHHVNPDVLWKDYISKQVWIKIRCIESGEVFESIRQAARDYGVPDWCMYKALNKHDGYCYRLNLTFERVKEEV